MKDFNIAKNILHIYNTHVPRNAVYGKYHASWGTRAVTYEKQGQTYTTYRHDKYNADIIYYVDDFATFAFKGHLHYFVHVWDTQREIWHEVKTSESPKYYGLANFLCEKFEEFDIKPNTKCEYYVNSSVLPTERKHQQFNNAYHANPRSYALSSNVIDNTLSPCTFERSKTNSVKKFNGDTTKVKPVVTFKSTTSYKRVPCEERPDPWD